MSTSLSHHSIALVTAIPMMVHSSNERHRLSDGVGTKMTTVMVQAMNDRSGRFITACDPFVMDAFETSL